MSKKSKIDPEKTKEMQKRTKERTLIIGKIKELGPTTIDELSRATSMEKSILLKHLIAMRQFGKISVAGERDHQLVYGLPEYSKS